MSRKNKGPVVLMILDGWGIAPPSKGNGITMAKTPTMDSLVKSYPAMTLKASGPEVGLRWGEMGNSEVGHANLGSGKIMYQNLPYISKSISDGSFFRNPALVKAMQRCSSAKHSFFTDLFGNIFHPNHKPEENNNHALHIMGVIGEGGVHGHSEHLNALLIMAQQLHVETVYLHLFLDGRDAIYNSGLGFVKELNKQIESIGVGKIASISGRFFAMDRDNHWERIEKTYQVIMGSPEAKSATNPEKAIEEAYAQKMYDEEFEPVVMVDEENLPVGSLRDGDSVIFFNFRSDRARELTKTFVLPEFDKFPRQYFPNLFFVTMMEYEKNLPVEVAFLPQKPEIPLAKALSDKGLKQLHIAETEKYVHVTYFFNGLQDITLPGEEDVVIPSPRIASYADQPEMSAKLVAQKVVSEIMADNFDFIVINFANPDMVGHTGNVKATIKAVESTDKCVKEIIDAVLGKDGVALITADHGNAEELINLQTGEIDKEHSTNPVPLLIIGNEYEGKNSGVGEGIGGDLSLMPPQGILTDVAPTILNILGIDIPEEMTGKPLI